MLTSSKFASEIKICEIANAFDKFITKPNGDEFMLSPFSQFKKWEKEVMTDTSQDATNLGENPYKR